MKSIVICSLLAALLAVASGASFKQEHEWNTFKRTHGKKYESPLEESLRKTIFMQNKDKINRWNRDEAAESGYTMKLNHLSDRTKDEMAQRNGFRAELAKVENSMESRMFLDKILSKKDIPESVDWRTVEGVVTGVKDQGQCGSCWAFSSTGALEGQMAKRNKTLDPLSEQNLVDCSHSNLGCMGGNMLKAWKNIAQEGGIEDEKAYPYTGIRGDCLFDRKKAVLTDKSGVSLNEGDEAELKMMVASFGPVSVAIDASHESFKHYHDGVYYEPNCNPVILDHAVLVVGYGTDDKHGDYWLVKNSWGVQWGQDGYIKMARNKYNHCGIASYAMIPTF